MKTCILLMFSSILAVLAAAATQAASLPSSKAAAALTDVAVVTQEANTLPDWTTILAKQLKTANQKDLSIDMSLECGLFTETNVKSKGGNQESANATVGVMLRVLVDGETAKPPLVTYCRRAQTLTATFQGIFQTTDLQEGYRVVTDAGADDPIEGVFYATLEECQAAGDADGVDVVNVCEAIMVAGTCLLQDSGTGGILLDLNCLQPEEVGLILDTMNASAFNFLMPNVTSGVHTIAVQAKVVQTTSVSCAQESEGLDCESDPLAQDAHAVIGWGSVFIEEVRLVKGDVGDPLELN